MTVLSLARAELYYVLTPMVKNIRGYRAKTKSADLMVRRSFVFVVKVGTLLAEESEVPDWNSLTVAELGLVELWTGLIYMFHLIT